MYAHAWYSLQYLVVVSTPAQELRREKDAEPRRGLRDSALKAAFSCWGARRLEDCNCAGSVRESFRLVMELGS